MSTRSGRIRQSVTESSPPRTRKGVSPPRSPARSRKSSPPARSTTQKSPSRKSPSRKPISKFPARKSPSRTTKEATETAAQNAQKSPSKRQAIKSDVSVTLQDVTKTDIFRGTRSRRSEYTLKDISSEITHNFSTPTALEKTNGVDGVDALLDLNDIYSLRNRKPVEEVAPRRSSRLRDLTDDLLDIRRSTSTSIRQSHSRSLERFPDEEEYSDDDMLMRKSESVTRKLATPLRESVSKLAQISSRWEFGGRIGCAVLMLLLPLTIFTMLISCTKSCSTKSLLDLTVYKSISEWFSWEAFAILTTQHFIQALLALVPILGTKADRMDESATKYYFNAFFASIFAINALFTMNFFDLYNSNSLLNDYLRLAVVSYVSAVILSIIMYVKSRKIDDSKLNPYGNTGYPLYDFCMGREIHPFVKNLDIKIWVSRIANINTLILAVLIFRNGFNLPPRGTVNLSFENYKEFLSKVQLKPTILLYSMMQIVYILNFIMREYKITSTFFWQSEGLGYLQIVSSALYPFYFTTISKFLLDTQLSLSTNTLIAASALFTLGFFIMLMSNNIKYQFRKNPLHPSLLHLDSMPTFHGKKLLVSSIWGVIRHPNYTGDILIHTALALPGLLTQHYMAAAPALLTIVLLLHRAWRDHARCRRRYGAAWERYCKRVPSIFIPKVF